jgi:hypothetical protein
VRLTRRELVAGGAAAALGAAGVYELLDRVAGSPPERPAGRVRNEQHLLDGLRVVVDEDVEVLVPPLHHEVVTAAVTAERGELADARAALEELLADLDEEYAPTPAGLGVTLAWGLPYFRRLVPDAAARHLPFDVRAGKPALLDARRFPSDPANTVLERNDVAILLRSDVRAHVDDALERLRGSGVFRVTSLRSGFAGGGFDGGVSLPKRMALAAGVRGAELIPDTAELFLGFTSTQRASMGGGRIANFETLGYLDLRASDYFRGGTHMHLSHMTEDLEAWYLNFDFDERVATTFRPGLSVRHGTQTVPQGPADVTSEDEVRRRFRSAGRIGHSSALQAASRLAADTVGPDGHVYERGTAIPIRADFNTLDNPFRYSARRGEVASAPVAGVHFVVFNPSSDDFERVRLAMDGVLPGGELDLRPRDRRQGFNSILRTTHRQNFLVPPRRHRSFPLAEL